MRVISISTTMAVVGFAVQAQAATELQWWHAMTGANNEMIEELTKEFNASQSTYKVVPVFKGTYPETLNAGIAAFRSKQPPAIIQVFDAGSGTMMAAEGAIVPAAEILQKGGFTSINRSIFPGSLPIIRSRMERCCPFRITLPRRFFTTIRTLFRKQA